MSIFTDIVNKVASAISRGVVKDTLKNKEQSAQNNQTTQTIQTQQKEQQQTASQQIKDPAISLGITDKYRAKEHNTSTIGKVAGEARDLAKGLFNVGKDVVVNIGGGERDRVNAAYSKYQEAQNIKYVMETNPDSFSKQQKDEMNSNINTLMKEARDELEGRNYSAVREVLHGFFVPKSDTPGTVNPFSDLLYAEDIQKNLGGEVTGNKNQKKISLKDKRTTIETQTDTSKGRGKEISEKLKNIDETNRQTFLTEADKKYKREIKEAIKYQKDIDSKLKNDPDYLVRGSGSEGLISDHKNTIVNNKIKPQEISLTDRENGGYIYFGKRDADKIVDKIMTDDIKNSYYNNYRFIEMYESWVDSGDPIKMKIVSQPRAKSAYLGAIDNLENLDNEVAYIYNNLQETDGDMYVIRTKYYMDTGRKMFQNSDKVRSDKYFKDGIMSSEDFAITAAKRLQRDLDYEEHSISSLEQAKNPTIIGELKATKAHVNKLLSDIIVGTNTLVNNFQWVWNEAQNTVDAFSDRVFDGENYAHAYERRSGIMGGMDSTNLIREEIVGTNSFTNKRSLNQIEEDLSPLQDSLPDIAAQAAILGGIHKTISRMLPSNAAVLSNSKNYVTATKLTRDMSNLSTKNYLKTKIAEFALRSAGENYVQGLAMSAEFVEPYSDADFAFDTMFGVLDGALILREYKQTSNVLKQNFRNERRADYFKETFDIADERRAQLTKRQQLGLGAQMRERFNNGVDEIAKQEGKTADEVMEHFMNSKDDLKAYANENVKQILDDLYNAGEKTFAEELENIKNIAVAANSIDPKLVPESLMKKIEKVEFTDLDGGIRTVYTYKKGMLPTASEINAIRNIQPTPKLQKAFANTVRDSYQSGVARRLRETRESIMQGRILEDQRTIQDIRLDDMNRKAERNRYLERLKIDDRDLFLKREFDKYGQSGQLFGDTDWSFIAAKDPEKEFVKRVEEFAKEKPDFKKKLNTMDETKFIDVDYGDTFYASQHLGAGRQNLVGIGYENALKINPNLEFVGEDFYKTIIGFNGYSNLEKNAILRAVPGKSKTVINVSQKKPNHIFGSLVEQNYFLGGIWGKGYAILPNGKKYEYVVSVADGMKIGGSDVYRITIKAGKENIQLFLNKGSIVLGTSDKLKKFDGKNIIFEHSDRKLGTSKFQVYNNYKDTVDGKVVVVKDGTSFMPGSVSLDQGELSLIDKIKNILKQEDEDFSSGRSFIKENSKRKSEIYDSYFVEDNVKFGYDALVDLGIDAPYSYYLYIKDMVDKGKMSAERGSELIISASISNIRETSDLYAITKYSHIDEAMKDFVFTKDGTIGISTNILNEQDGKIYLRYVKVGGTDGIYNLLDAEGNIVGRMGINTDPKSGKALLQVDGINGGEVFQADELFVIKRDMDDVYIGVEPRSRNMTPEELKENALKRRISDEQQLEDITTQSVNWDEVVTDEKGRSHRVYSDKKETPTDKFDDLLRNKNSRTSFTQYNRDIKIGDSWLLGTLTALKEFAIINSRLFLSNKGIFETWIKNIFIEKAFKKYKKTIKGFGGILDAAKHKQDLARTMVASFDGKMYMVINPRDLGLGFNYIPDTKSITVKVYDNNIEQGRILTIDSVGDYDIVMLNNGSYIRYIDEQGAFMIKLDESINGVQKNMEQNPLKASKEEILRTNQAYIVKDSQETIYSLLPYFRGFVNINGRTADEVLETMINIANKDDLTKRLIGNKEYTDYELLVYFIRSQDIKKNIINPLHAKTGISKKEIINAYIEVQNRFPTPKELLSQGDKYVQQRIEELLSLSFDMKLNKRTYGYISTRVKALRYENFIYEYTSGAFEKGLDLSTASGWNEYISRIKAGWDYVCSTVDPKTARKELSMMTNYSNAAKIRAREIRNMTTESLNKIIDSAYKYSYYSSVINRFLKKLDGQISQGKLINVSNNVSDETIKLVDDFLNLEFTDQNILEFFDSLGATNLNQFDEILSAALINNDVIDVQTKMIALNKAMLNSDNYSMLSKINQSPRAVEVVGDSNYNKALSTEAETKEQIIKSEEINKQAIEKRKETADDVIANASGRTQKYTRKPKVNNNQISISDKSEKEFLKDFWTIMDDKGIPGVQKTYQLFNLRRIYILDKISGSDINNFIQTPAGFGLVMYSIKNGMPLPQRIIDAVEMGYGISLVGKTYDEISDDLMKIRRYNNKDGFIIDGDLIRYETDHVTNTVYQDALFYGDTSEIAKITKETSNDGPSQLSKKRKIKDTSDKLQKEHGLNYHGSEEYNVTKSNAIQNGAVYNIRGNTSFITTHEFNAIKEMDEDLLKIMGDPNFTGSKEFRYVNVPLAHSYKGSGDLGAIEKHIVKKGFDSNSFVRKIDDLENTYRTRRADLQADNTQKLSRFGSSTDLQRENITKQINKNTKEIQNIDTQLEQGFNSNYYTKQTTMFNSNDNIVALSYGKSDDLQNLTKKAMKDSQGSNHIIIRGGDSLQNIDLAKSLENSGEFSIINKSERYDGLTGGFYNEIHLSRVDNTGINGQVLDNESIIDNLVEDTLCTLGI